MPKIPGDSQKVYLLLIDKFGVFGNALLEEFAKNYFVVFVSNRQPAQEENVLHIAYRTRLPKLPDVFYSAFVVIDDGSKALRDSLSTLLKKAESDKSSFTLVTSIYAANGALTQQVALHRNCRTVLVGDVFGEEALLAAPFCSVAEAYMQMARKERVAIRGDELEDIFPLSFARAREKILEACLSQKTNAVLSLYPTSPLTKLAFCRLLQKIDPNVSLDFAPGRETKPVYFPTRCVFLDTDESLFAALKHYLQALQSLPKKDQPQAIDAEQKRSRFFPSLLLAALAVMLLPLVLTIACSLIGFVSLLGARRLVTQGDLSAAKRSAGVSSLFFAIAEETSLPISFFSSLVGQRAVLTQVRSDIASGKEIAGAFSSLIQASDTLLTVFTNKSSNREKDFYTAVNLLKQGAVTLQKLSVDNTLPEALTAKLDQNTASPLRFFTATSDALPMLLGFQKKMTYLLLFQNNTELRPGGGFIGSYAIVSLDKGIVSDFRIFDVYDADGQLKGHVEPPYPIRRYLPSAHLYMRDSNFDVDFSKSASQVAFMLEAETGQTVDGVIAFDVSTIENIISAFGSVYVPAYRQTVTADNFYRLTEEHAEKNFFPGSSQKKDFLNALFRALENRVGTNRHAIETVLGALSESLAEKHLLFSFASTSLQNLFTVNGWSSSLWDTRVSDSTHTADFLGISEANLGVDKANYYIRRKIEQSVTVNDAGDLTEMVNILYKNLSGGQQGMGYKNYLRLIVPSDAVLTGIAINGTAQKIVPAVTDFLQYESPAFVALQGLEVNKTAEEGKTLYGFLVHVDAGELQTLTVTFVLPKRVSGESFSYDLRFFKQPGTDAYSYTFSFTYPVAYSVVKRSQDLEHQNGTLTFAKQIATDTDLSFELTKK